MPQKFGNLRHKKISTSSSKSKMTEVQVKIPNRKNQKKLPQVPENSELKEKKAKAPRASRAKKVPTKQEAMSMLLTASNDLKQVIQDLREAYGTVVVVAPLRV